MLNIIQSRPDEMAFVKDENKFYQFKNKKWEEMKMNCSSSLEFTQYDLNKQMMANNEPYTEEERKKAEQGINSWRKDNKDSKFFMLLCRDINYYTIFSTTQCLNQERVSLGKGVLECLDNVGDIYSVNEAEDNAIEIWAKVKDEFVVLYLFPYDSGIVEIGD